MSERTRQIRPGDYVIIDDVPRIITSIDRGIIRAGIIFTQISLIWNGNRWEIEGQGRNHTISFKGAPNLRVATFNLGNNITMNIPLGSEKNMVLKCQAEYGNSSECTVNAITLLSEYNLIGLQEVPVARREFIKNIFPSHYQYIMGANIMTAYDPTITGPGMRLTSEYDLLIDRGFQITYFPDISLLFINLHAPHNIDIKREIETKCKMYTQRAERVILAGDFNDFMGTLDHVTIFSHKLIVPAKIKTCCDDSRYSNPGDYIIPSDKYWGYYGYHPGYIRHQPLMSDHDPVVLITEI